MAGVHAVFVWIRQWVPEWTPSPVPRSPRTIRRSVRRLARSTTRARPAERAAVTGIAVNVLLVLTLLLSAVSVGYVLTLPDDRYTEFSVLAPNESGDLVAHDYPRELVRGEPTPLALTIANHERAGSAYTVVIQLQRVQLGDDGTVRSVNESRTLTRERVVVAPGDARRIPYELVPNMTGENLRVRFLLYRAGPDASRDAGDAYRTLHLWVDVSADAGANETGESGQSVEPPPDEGVSDQ